MEIHRERLNERTSHADDAIVCSHGNTNHERRAEQKRLALFFKKSNKKVNRNFAIVNLATADLATGSTSL